MRKATLGQKVKEARIAKQMTQKELAGDFITRNMLSQIENDTATPSMKTLEYIASVLEKPMSYFVDEEQDREHAFLEEVMGDFEQKAYDLAMEKLEKRFEDYPRQKDQGILKNLYINSCLNAAKMYKAQGAYEKARNACERILNYETDLLMESECFLYNVYSELTDIYGYMGMVDEAKVYNDKAREMVEGFTARRVIQSTYISFLEGAYDQAIDAMKQFNVASLDPYDQGRYYMTIGSSFYYKGDYGQAVDYLEMAVHYYLDPAYSTMRKLIYEQLSKAYSHLEEYKKAYEYLEKTKEY